MVDGKVSNFLVGNKATLKCPVCFKTSKEFAHLTSENYDHSDSEIKERLKVCLNPLHSKLKLFDFLLKISRTQAVYNFKVKNPNLTKTEISAFLNSFISSYEKKFFNELKAHIDFVKPGYGKSTTGPNIMRALKDYKKCANILQIDPEFIQAINGVSSALNSLNKPNYLSWKRNVDTILKIYNNKFKKFCSLTPSVHKILCHGWAMMAILDHGPGFYSEQSQEKLNKSFRQIREFNSRKTSYKDMLEDIFTLFYIKSDPIIFSENF